MVTESYTKIRKRETSRSFDELNRKAQNAILKLITGRRGGAEQTGILYNNHCHLGILFKNGSENHKNGADNRENGSAKRKSGAVKPKFGAISLPFSASYLPGGNGRGL